MSFDMEFFGLNSWEVNNELGGGQKWIRDTVFEHTGLSLEIPGGYVPSPMIALIADRLESPASTCTENDVLQRVYKIFLQAKSMNLDAIVSW